MCGKPTLFMNLPHGETAMPCAACTAKSDAELDAKRNADREAARQAALEKTLLNAGLAPSELTQTLDNWQVEYPEQRAVLEAIRAYDGRAWILLTGTPGTGKSHLAHGILRTMVEKQTWRTAISMTAPSLFRRYNTTAFDAADNQGFGESTAFDDIADVDGLLVHDLGTRSLTEPQLALLTDVLDFRYRFRKATILTTNLPPPELSATIGPRATDRFYELALRHNGEPFFVCTWPSYRRTHFTPNIEKPS